MYSNIVISNSAKKNCIGYSPLNYYSNRYRNSVGNRALSIVHGADYRLRRTEIPIKKHVHKLTINDEVYNYGIEVVVVVVGN